RAERPQSITGLVRDEERGESAARRPIIGRVARRRRGPRILQVNGTRRVLRRWHVVVECCSEQSRRASVGMVVTVNPCALFFDLDDTIVSFSTGQERLWSTVLSKHADALAVAGAQRDLAVLSRVLEEVVGPAYWADEERAVRGRLELYRARREVLTLGLRELGWELPEAEAFRIADAYTDAKERAVAPLGDAITVVHQLRQRGYPLALLTNGGSEFQRRKIRRYELDHLFDAILIEGEWGVGKPHRSV